MDTEWIISGAICTDKRGNKYNIVTKARDIQTGETIVVYTQEFGDEETLCCPIDAFNVSFSAVSDENPTKEPVKEAPITGEQRMMMFFDADSFQEKSRILKEMHILGELTDGIIDNFAATIDAVIEEGSIEERFDQLRICVDTRARFEGSRLR